tara:strand:+ start:7209 stop:7787 length:579 start_codon:yes stop_codon:yes gene_type:complete
MCISQKELYEEFMDVWETDRNCRFNGIKGDLHTLPVLDLSAEWEKNPPFPTIKQTTVNPNPNLNHQNQISYYPYPKTNKEFSKRFFEACPYFNNMNFDNVCVAGGVISHLLKFSKRSIGTNFGKDNRNFRINTDQDIDIFLYGFKSSDEAIKKIKYIYNHFTSNKLIDGIKFMINQNLLTFFIQYYKTPTPA